MVLILILAFSMPMAPRLGVEGYAEEREVCSFSFFLFGGASGLGAALYLLAHDAYLGYEQRCEDDDKE